VRRLEQRSVSIALSWLILPLEVSVNRHGLKVIPLFRYSVIPYSVFYQILYSSPSLIQTHLCRKVFGDILVIESGFQNI